MRALVTLVLVGCGSPSTPPPDGGDDVDAPPGCTRPSLDDPKYATLLEDAISQLPAPRATTTQRNSARAFLMTKLGEQGWTPQLHNYNSGANVHTTIPATVGGPAVVLGAHFDTVPNSPGANDNGSGTAVVLAVAAILADVPCRTAPVTIVFFDEEEVGLFGSRAFALILSPANIRAVHTIDQVSFDGDGDRRFEIESPTPTLEAEWRAAAAVVGVPVSVVPTEGTDHEAFRDRGFAAVGLTEEFVGGDTSPDRHLSTDTVAKVDTDYLALAMKLTAQVVIEQISP